MPTVTRQTVTGLRELGRALQSLKSDMQKRIARSTTNAGAQVVKKAVAQEAAQQPTLADAPFRLDNGAIVQPGEIARNVIVKRLPDPEVTSEHIVAVLSNSRNGYIGRIASLNEFGTVKMSKQPFMGPGFNLSKKDALETMVKTLDKGIEAAARKAKKA